MFVNKKNTTFNFKCLILGIFAKKKKKTVCQLSNCEQTSANSNQWGG